VTPEVPLTGLKRGYLNLSATWLKRNPHFTVSIPIKPRFISPHPFTNQSTVSIARGPLLYCVEDVDNLWVEDHFKTLLFDSSQAVITETQKTDKETEETYIALSVDGAACSFLQLDSDRGEDGPGMKEKGVGAGDEGSVPKLNFVPFYYRGNRKGRGMMRVGLRKR
jgi:DUF1680 family protein